MNWIKTIIDKIYRRIFRKNVDVNLSMPKTLFIIGNGFDCYFHNLPTRYLDFKKYLMERFPDYDIDFDGILSPRLMPDGEEKYDDDELVGAIIRMLDSCAGKDWCDLEGCLGEAFIHGIVGDNEWLLKPINIEDEDDDAPYKAVMDNEDISGDLTGAFRMVRILFEDWVRKELPYLDYEKIQRKSTPNLKDSLFLSFNYTPTLESVYGIQSEQVCHIHGDCRDKSSKIYFGHGNCNEVDVESWYWGIKEAFDRLQEELRKDTDCALYNNAAFFDKLKSITDVYSYGFSFSDVDMIYIDRISKIVDVQNVVWHFNKYDWDKNHHYIDKIKAYGYKVVKESIW